ncbi:glycosyltransferase [Thermococcus barophilus]|uniref:GDP-Man:Man(1)GlcNAc(2)-PP-Dol alpha-1,3-mannosyltransferase n=1 Tax=Thermococcus barophilus TaxID=55802 RepID=A0A0S1XED9_THEBA|nr:glycosyltransferase [Thermococcus barophilus]ALM76151.1 Mannosyltransferase [Thermococcus barophilus]
MKIAVIHDRFVNRGGAERVALEIAKALKVDTIYTAHYEPEKTFEEIQKFNIIEIHPTRDVSWDKQHAINRMVDGIKFSFLKEVSEYDLIWTSGMWAMFASKNNPRNIWYCHSPNRALYDLYEHFKKRYHWIGWKGVFIIWASFWRKIDQYHINFVREIVVNSRNTKRRVKAAYNRRSEVIHPPVDTKKFYWGESEGYWLSVQRIMPEKRVELQIEIFKKVSGENLIIVGNVDENSQYYRMIKKKADKLPNVRLMVGVDDKTLVELYAHSKGVIQTAIDEDFGLVPIEAMAAGKPVFAVNEGGFRETVIDGITGRLINPPYLENFIKAIKEFDETKYNPKVIRTWAENFSVEKFRDKIKKKTKEVIRNE